MNSHWLGLQWVYGIIGPNGGGGVQYEMRVDLSDCWQNYGHITYTNFYLGPSPTYTINFHGFKSGNTIPDSIHSTVGFFDQLGKPFSTPDKQQNTGYFMNCGANMGGGWWFSSCPALLSFLTGEFHADCKVPSMNKGIMWNMWKSPSYSLYIATMKIKPINNP
jgi:hypothetical protein